MSSGRGQREAGMTWREGPAYPAPRTDSVLVVLNSNPLEAIIRKRLAIGLAATVFLGAALGQRAGRLNPPHLAEMPVPEQVVAAITGADPQEAAARRIGAFQQLQDLIEELSNGRTALGNDTPDEKRLRAEYAQARYEAMKPYEDRANRDADFLQSLRRFDNDPALREEILNRFFSPALRAQSQAVTRQLNARIAASRQRNEAFGGTAQAPPPAVAPRQTAPMPAAPPRAAQPPPPLEPTVARAKAGGVDTRVFGIQLGERLALPACNIFSLGTAAATTCLAKDVITELATQMVNPGGRSLSVIKLARSNCPGWMSDCSVDAQVDASGRLIGIVANTDGYAVEEQAMRELTAKYGRRFGRLPVVFTRDENGAKYSTSHYDWNLSGLRVLYFAVEDNLKRGRLIVETEEAFQRRLALTREAKRPKL
ncbi:MAG: hypothetical protein IT164_12895 [Bryobacterales bacterium]|nr:hypothetical protein [Bryobacterales bacterium]